MIIKGIDDEKCIKCLECVKDCPSSLFYKPPTEIGEKRRVIFEDPNDGCIECGHCVAICPTSAILYEAEDEALEFEEAKSPDKILDYEDLIKFIRVRRSIRRYKDKEVPKEVIESVLDAIRYAPSARNDRAWKYIVLKDEENIDKIRQAVIKMLGLLKKIVDHKRFLKYFLPKSIKHMVTESRTEVSLNNFFEEVDQGKDPVFYEAPVLLISYAPELNSLALNDAGIALTHGMFAAQSLGLGTCWIGYAQEAINRYDELKKMLGISDEMKITGVLILGYPDLKFHRAPPRGSLDVYWM
ncbi:MAG: NAD(P)H-quinone oxidoreductase subunit I, chloroplastic [Promethearchaeota archaeon]|jgi:nitroreductase/NAD-dependent dihydropyrimidine dehydrogenase PreA subunit|nr:MAG: NAD(P)H-quinone oxidoreductase subunit I, chloroplastic [Candidatus Lokiarchaeota archaeon]